MRFADIRGLLVLGHIVIIAIAALPNTRGNASKEALEQPAARAELQLWGERLGVSPARLAAFALALSERWDRAYGAVFSWIEPYLRLTGTYQPWAVFIAPNRFPTRFQIQVHDARAPLGIYRTAFEEGSSALGARWPMLSQERCRVYFELQSWPRFAWLGPEVCRWAARRLYRSDASLDGVRCRAYRAPSLSPEQAARRDALPGEWLHVDYVAR